TRRNGSVLISGNSSWNFSGTGVVEIALVKAGRLRLDQPLSEQYTMDCGSNGGCNGDDNTTVLEWAKKTGLPLTSEYGPYQADSGRCKSAAGQLYKVHDWGFVDHSGYNTVSDTALVKAAIM